MSFKENGYDLNVSIHMRYGSIHNANESTHSCLESTPTESLFKQMVSPSMYRCIVVVGRYITGMSRLSRVWSRLPLKNFFKQNFLPSINRLLESMYRLTGLMY